MTSAFLCTMSLGVKLLYRFVGIFIFMRIFRAETIMTGKTCPPLGRNVQNDHEHERYRFPRMLGAFALLGMFALAPVIYQKLFWCR